MTKSEKAAVFSILTNSVLTVVKFLLASITASVALLAEAYHSFADILSSVMVLLALRADRRANSQGVQSQQAEETQVSKPGRKLFSPGNWENKVAIGIGVLLVIVALSIFGKVSQPGIVPLRYPSIAAIVVGFLALCSYLLYRFEVSVARETGSTSLTADGHHAQSDMLTSVLVVIALVATKVGLALDRIAAAIIGIFILSSAMYILAQAVRSYSASIKGREFSRGVIYEDILFLLLFRTYAKLDRALWKRIETVPWLQGPPESMRRKLTMALLGVAIFLAGCAYAFSGVYLVQPGERAIIERFGKPLQPDSPLGPGLHYHWPWPIEAVKKADVEGIRRLSVGYKTGDQKGLILWTNIHYLREYSVITGEGPFLDVAMNVHYGIEDLYKYLYTNADPDATIEKISYHVLRGTLGTRPFFSSMTIERDTLETLILEEIQKRADQHALGLRILNVCFRDVHPPAQVAFAFEDVVSAQEDYETYIEQANRYRKDILPRARGEAATALSTAQAYRHAAIAQSVGKTQSFILQERVFSQARELTETRMVLETVEETLSDIPKYVIDSGNGEKPDLWFYLSPAAGSASGGSREVEPTQVHEKGKTRISSEEDLIDAILRFHQGQEGK
ncbi:MAG: FtsH protease activity modulator HflK [Candidatus Abyssobacteria bacterium SURF_17]|uniref:Protein HflK n=1 Tax=Candidatus Abyssobacteria bacterium SURF_17 TaxID=2093361 RepID=A0A419EPH6_9BACT|nr:MAG: FtsH protease activity modulator HflK [Candidatus Abyssubacteria bacterium SURF_17]